MRKRAAKYAASLFLQSGGANIQNIKLDASGKFHLESCLRNSELRAALPKSAPEKIRALLLKRPSRTASGVTPVALMVKPEGSCKYSCIYCPFTGKAAKSYTGFEPAALRARQFHFDSFAQVQGRLSHFAETGHPTDKCEAIVMGGTFLKMPLEYKTSFIKGMYDGFNGKRSRTLAQAKKRNETAKRRVVGLTIETRPDVCKKPQINEMLGFGATRVEMGVQHPDDEIYRLINRGHSVKDVVEATAFLKDSAFKVCYHMMPGLPGSSPEKDVAMAESLFSDPRFKPDMLKIYPTLVMPGTGLFKMMERGEYSPYTSEEAAHVISEFYRHIPSWVRVMRIQRDIPSGLIGAGVMKSNLRELVDAEICRKGIISKEIRSNEIGQSDFSSEKANLSRVDYEASGGREVFLSYDWKGKIIGFIRLRNPASPFRKEIGKDTAIIRELHVYGSEAGLAQKRRMGAAPLAQHRSFGSLLLCEAERIAREEFGKKEMVVISGVGVRPYYYKHGYSPKGPYVAKKI